MDQALSSWAIDHSPEGMLVARSTRKTKTLLGGSWVILSGVISREGNYDYNPC